MGYLWLAFAVSICFGLCSARHFEVSDEDPCILLDVEFNIEVKAIENDTVVATKYLTSSGRDIKAMGLCTGNYSDIGIFFYEKSSWIVDFRPYKDHPVAMYRLFQFEPAEIFGEVVNDTDILTFEDPRPVYLKNNSHSYVCEADDKQNYITQDPSRNYNYT
ncbi:hypothetical protein ElyMa_002981500, partial [Elysia marginata]